MFHGFGVQGLKLTACIWKWRVGIRSFPSGMAYFRGRTVSFRECIHWTVHDIIKQINRVCVCHFGAWLVSHHFRQKTKKQVTNHFHPTLLLQNNCELQNAGTVDYRCFLFSDATWFLISIVFLWRVFYTYWYFPLTTLEFYEPRHPGEYQYYIWWQLNLFHPNVPQN